MENDYFSLIANDIKKLWNGLDHGQKLGMLFLIVATIIAATFFLSKAMEPDWVVLYTDLNEINAMNIVESLRKNGHQYKVSEDKKTILVPPKSRDQLRLFVAENDLINTGDAGFELLDDMQLGSTDFKNKLTKQRIFQGEITRAIEKIHGIRYAKVQIAEPERSIFDDNDEKPTASVILVLEPGVKLKSAQVKAIKNMVAYSVPRMTPDQVFITDQTGYVLSDETSKNSTDMESFKLNLERQTAKKVTEVLEKLAGRGNVSVQVNADIDFNSAKATIESYVPVEGKTEGVLVSSQTEVETYENPNLVPNTVNTTATQRNLNYSKQKTATNYNVSKEVKQVIYAPGTVKRMTVAVAINKILTEAEKDEVKALVTSAAGIDLSRGDVISLSGMQFEGLKLDKAINEEFNRQYQKVQLIDTLVDSLLPLIIVAILGLFAMFILKSLVSKLPSLLPDRKLFEEANARPVIDDELSESAPAIKEVYSKREVQTKKEQTINELNEAIMSSPEDAAKLITSYIRE